MIPEQIPRCVCIMSLLAFRWLSFSGFVAAGPGPHGLVSKPGDLSHRLYISAGGALQSLFIFFVYFLDALLRIFGTDDAGR